MPLDKRIDQLAPVVPEVTDLIALYDLSSPGTKKITIGQIVALINTIAGTVTTIWATATESNSFYDARLIGRNIRLVLLGGIGSGEIITSGTPTGNQLLFDSLAGTLTKPSGDTFADGELLTIMYL
jgi:hypothetical protein